MPPVTDLNVSVRWKLLGAFAISAGWPVLAMQLEIAMPALIISTALLAMSLGWYSGQRVLGVITRLGRGVSAQLGSSLDSPGETRDELAALEHAFDHLITAASGLPHAPHAPRSSGRPRAEYHAGLATGASICGEAVMYPEPEPDLMLMRATLTGVAARQSLRQAIDSVICELRELMANTQVGEVDVLEFQELSLQDQSLIELIEVDLSAGRPLVESVERAFVKLRTRFKSMDSPYMQARAMDFDDLRKRLVNAMLGGHDESQLRKQVAGRIVLCQQILPSEVVALSRCAALGVVSVKGTAASHSEILLNAFAMPGLCRFEDIDLHALVGHQLLLDIPEHKLVVDPDVACRNLAETAAAHVEPDLEHALLTSGERVVVGVTINNVAAEAEHALAIGADDVGLFRTEVDYIASGHLPTEAELTARYQELVRIFEGRAVIMRMLDLGSDKLSSFQQTEHEDNPCMGNRSMRLLLSEPSLFRTQFRAMLRAATDNTAIIFPMVSGWYELEQIQRHIDAFIAEFAGEGHRIPKLRYGLMLEVPSVVERFEDYVEAFDVFNVGTNDLTQYTLAADRNNEQVVSYYKCYHPSILSMLRKVCQLATTHNKSVCVCGEMAGDLNMVPLLIGLGVTRLSVPAGRITAVKRHIRTLDLSACETLANAALACRSTAQIEALLYTQAE